MIAARLRAARWSLQSLDLAGYSGAAVPDGKAAILVADNAADDGSIEDDTAAELKLAVISREEIDALVGLGTIVVSIAVVDLLASVERSTVKDSTIDGCTVTYEVTMTTPPAGITFDLIIIGRVFSRSGA
jgi:hypothetical protein